MAPSITVPNVSPPTSPTLLPPGSPASGLESNPLLVCRPLLKVFEDIPDVRRRQGRRYGLSSLLGLSSAAMLCGYRTYGAIAEWVDLYGGELASALGVKVGRRPCAATFFNAFRKLDRDAVEAALAKWAEEVCRAVEVAGGAATQLNGVTPRRRPALAIDGKTLRGTAKQRAPGAHLLSAVEHELGITLGQTAVNDKTNEITAVQQVLQGLVLEGRVITVDALLTQREVAKTIVQKRGTTSCP